MGKGMQGGECNRTACHNPDAQWFNRSTRAYYCGECAMKLNHANPVDALRLFNGPLCVYSGTPEARGDA